MPKSEGMAGFMGWRAIVVLVAVIPACAGMACINHWIPAFAGMTAKGIPAFAGWSRRAMTECLLN